MEKFRRLLSSVGARTFVEYYEVFEANKFSDSCEEIKEALREKDIWKESAIAIKANCGKRIFKTDQEIDVLMYIACKARNVTNDVREKAREILHTKDVYGLKLTLELM